MVLDEALPSSPKSIGICAPNAWLIEFTLVGMQQRLNPIFIESPSL